MILRKYTIIFLFIQILIYYLLEVSLNIFITISFLSVFFSKIGYSFSVFPKKIKSILQNKKNIVQLLKNNNNDIKH